MDERKRISADAIRGKGHIEAIAIASALSSPNESIELYRQQLTKPLSNDEIELMLSNQAIVLNSIANKNLEIGTNILFSVNENPIMEKLTKNSMRNAFKAMEMSRKCLTALNEIRNPKRSATFIKQQNNQLNLNGDHDGSKTMDRITESKTESFNPNMATLENVHRREDIRGQN
ncbi:hypothetical protein [Pseudanabaena sp. ABRG5-3]|uniref:hypothetical protein n=1 Tax=Pseudanabaena sp. ABRG5-3 TaxID=685565 RepID=UPI000DC6D5B5|nr:hypothetical protein [Pseudanabaena sp. ABRG5-3]BBC27229.1 hypothetical protein ABRG53_g003 [Pseudanabaena sp. ABRG5-3]